MKFLISLFWGFIPSLLFANAAAPGFWGAEGIKKFTYLNQRDSLAVSHIQMVKEVIAINLYQGYSVIKGTYWMFNYSDYPLTIQVGYPVNTSENYWTPDNKIVRFKDLSNLIVYSNNRVKLLFDTPVFNFNVINDNWYI